MVFHFATPLTGLAIDDTLGFLIGRAKSGAYVIGWDSVRSRIAQRLPISILQQYGWEAPVVLREWADELEALVRVERGELPQVDLN